MSINPTSALYIALEKALPAKLFYPGSSPYNASQNSFFLAQQSQLTLACIVRPTTSHDVAIFMKTLRVEKLPLRLAIRGGGHSTVVGSSNIEGGIMLNMRGMNNVSLLENGQIVSVRDGAVWGGIYS
jgi:FAD/FMN-containing dehydrogenase